MEEQESTIFEVREEVIVSPTGKNPCSRTARFLKPTFKSGDKPHPKIHSHALPSGKPCIELQDLPLSVSFHGWRCRATSWTDWVEKMASLHESTWKKAGIYDAVLSSNYQVKRNIDLVLGVAEKWCCDTKSFIFPWGEASITLEDVMVLGGYSVLGSPVFGPIENAKLKEVEESLKNARIEIVRSKAKKACPRLWMQKFMDTGSEIEHEAFLAFWLSRYVFTNAHETIREHVFSIAIHLARGTRIALAPAVLASIYRDLCLLKDAIVASTKFAEGEVLALTLWSPFQLVQVWAWERFLGLRPEPNLLQTGQPRLARWHEVNYKVENVKSALESASEKFEWRPYALPVENWKFPKFYREKEALMSLNSRLDKEVESFARCLRASELVGLDCVEQYLPHRVAMQLGFDQEIPGCVSRSNESPETAWRIYSEAIADGKLYVPSRVSRAGVTTQYLKWWKQTVLKSKGANRGVEKQKTGQKSSEKSSKKLKVNEGGNSGPICAGSHHKRSRKSSETVEGKTKANNSSGSPDCSTTSSRKKVQREMGDSSASDSSPPQKKSKSVAEILEAEKVDNDDPGSYGKTTKGATNLKRNKSDKEGSTSPCLPLECLKESALSLKRKKQKNYESSTPGLQQKQMKKSKENSNRNQENEHKSLSPGSCPENPTKSVQLVKENEEPKVERASQALPLENSRQPSLRLKRKQGNNFGARGDCKQDLDQKDSEHSLEDNNPTIAELLKSCKRRARCRPREGDEGVNLSGQSESLSSTIADDGAINNLEPLAILAEKIIQNEAVLKRSRSDVNEDQGDMQNVSNAHVPVGSHETHRDTNEANAESPGRNVKSTYGSGGEGREPLSEVPSLTLEDRISRLEKLVNELKAAGCAPN